MPYYETVLIARQDLNEAQVNQLADELGEVITAQGGKIHKTEQWGLRTLAYRINKARKGHYVLIESDAPAPAIHELERRMRINEDVVRYLTVRQEKLSDGPSVMMDKSGGRYESGENDNEDRKSGKHRKKEEAA